MRSRRTASCSSASALRSSHSPVAASWCIRLRIRIHASRPVAAYRSSSPISPADGLVVGRIVSSVSPRPTRAGQRSRLDRRSMRARCASWSCGSSRQRCRPTMCTAAPRWFNYPKKSWNVGLGDPHPEGWARHDTVLKDSAGRAHALACEYMTDRPLTPVIVGPTGVGKTAVAVAIADLVPITVISADARQVYRGLDIGTAKPDRATRARVPHRGLDLITAGERYSAGRFAREAAGWIAEAVPNGRRPIVVGGTGLYIRALAEGLFREPPFDADRRAVFRTWSEALEGGGLARWAGRLDPRFPGGGRQRAARAVEVALLTGHALSWWQQVARERGTLHPWYIHLTVPREVLHRRLAARVDAMLRAGFVQEVQRVLASGVAPQPPGLDGVGSREVVAMLQGQLSESALRDAILVSTRRYAKRQDTWFRNQLREAQVWTIDATETADVIAGRILERWQR